MIELDPGSGAAVRDGASLLAAIGTLSLGAIAARRGPLGRRIAALCFVLFGWNFAVLAQRVAHQSRPFEMLDGVCTALSPPLVLEVVIAFIGAATRHRGARIGAWSTFGALALASLLAPDSQWWAFAFLGSWIVIFGFEIALLVRYLRATPEPQEKARARTVLAALAVAGACSTSDMAHAAGLPAPYLGALGTVVAAALLITLVVRLDLFESRVSARTTMYVVGMIAAAVAAYLVVLSAFAERLGIQLLFACLVTLIGAAITRELALSLAEARARTQRLALVGRFSAQMTHDIRGPLTAMLGAAQVLEGARSEAESREYLALVTDQAKRIAMIVDRYDRMARIEPQKTLVSVNELAFAIARAHAAETDLATGDPELDADRALLEAALENVVRNAVEATGQASLVRIGTEIALGTLRIQVTDQGPGMDARVLERATEDFFTTKPNGSGLGLAFARRVVEAHGGTLTLRSRKGEGTRVTLAFPVSPERASGRTRSAQRIAPASAATKRS